MEPDCFSDRRKGGAQQWCQQSSWKHRDEEQRSCSANHVAIRFGESHVGHGSGPLASSRQALPNLGMRRARIKPTVLRLSSYLWRLSQIQMIQGMTLPQRSCREELPCACYELFSVRRSLFRARNRRDFAAATVIPIAFAASTSLTSSW